MSPVNLDAALDAAKETARAAGALLRERFTKPHTVSSKSTRIDLVTEADLASESLIRESLSRLFPAPILGEEAGGARPEEDTPLWVVDPLDGTVNYAHRFPVFAVSIALCAGKQPVAGVIYDPLREELFSAAKGKGAFLNEAPIKVTNVQNLREALLATGFPYDRHTSEDDNTALHRAFLKVAQGIRRAGSAALDLAYIAAGRLDGYWEKKLSPWDLAAGELLVTEAGGTITDLSGAHTDPFSGEVVASGGPLHPEMLRIIRETTGSA